MSRRIDRDQLHGLRVGSAIVMVAILVFFQFRVNGPDGAPGLIRASPTAVDE